MLINLRRIIAFLPEVILCGYREELNPDHELHRSHRFCIYSVLRVSRLLSHHLNNYIPVPSAVIKVDEDNLLPCPQCHFTHDDRDGE